MSNSSEHGHDYHIVVNGREQTIHSDRVTYKEAVELAGYPPPTDGVEYIVTFRHAVKPEHGDLIPGEHVIVKDGTEFVVEPSNRS